MKIYHFILLIAITVFYSCAHRKTDRVVERFPNKEVKTYQKVSTVQVCRENCRIVKAKRTREEYYENGKLKSVEKTLTETTLDGQLRTAKNYSRFFDEKGKLTKKVNRNEFAGTTYLYENGKLVAKTSFDQ